jgi:acetolactate synthase-1/2/3 large subunit
MRKKFQEAKKPLIALGLTAARMKLHKKIRVLLEKHHLPCVLTPMAKGIISQNMPNYVGVLFHALSHMLNPLINQTDLVVGIGYDPVEYNYESWMPDIPLIHLDTIPADVDKTINIAGNIVGNLEYSITQLNGLKPHQNLWNFGEIIQNKQKLLASLRPKTDGFSPSLALDVLREEMDQEGILTCDVGAHTHLIGQLWKTPNPDSLIMTNGWSSMGFGLPAAIGAKIAFPEKQVVCVSGDGGFLMMLGDLITARRLRLNITFIILTDNRLSLIDIKQKRRKYNNFGVTLYKGDLFQSKTLLGIPIYSADYEEKLRRNLQKAFSGLNPVIIETKIDGSVYEKLIARS